jgi:hypothetical protein
MARPLRIELAGGRYHITTRATSAAPTFPPTGIGNISWRSWCFGVRLRAYVLMDNRYHLLLVTKPLKAARSAS